MQSFRVFILTYNDIVLEKSKFFSSYGMANTFIVISVYWSPFFDHLKEAWELRHHPNMMFLFYEELTQVKELEKLNHRFHFVNVFK